MNTFGKSRKKIFCTSFLKRLWVIKGLKLIWLFYIKPIEPAVNPITKKNENSAKSRGNELTISFIWVIWPCAPQVFKFLKI